MGNKNIQGLPPVITKNWHSISPSDDVFKSKLTFQCVRQQIIKISTPQQIEGLKNRMKETNPYICRVVFYSHISEDDYYVYTDQTRNKPYVHNLQQWRIHKQNIVDAFISLAKRYGLTRVCSQMIGVDLNGQIKVWINPNPALSQPWFPCLNESQMIADILVICRFIRELSVKNNNQEVKDLEEVNRTHVVSNDLTLKNHQQTHRRKHTGQAKKGRRSYKKDRKFIPQSQRSLVNITGSLKISDSKTKCSSNQKQKSQVPVYDSFTSMVHGMSNSSIQDQLIQNRSRTEFLEPPREKKYQKQLAFTYSHFKLNKPPERFSLRKKQKQNSVANFKNSIEKVKKLQNEFAQRINQIKKSLAIYREKKALQDVEIKNYRLTLNNYGKKLGVICLSSKWISEQKLSNKLGNVVYMPVRQERESQLTYDERQIKTPGKKSKESKQLTISQELLQFFEEEDVKETGTPRRQRRISGAYQQFRKQVSELFY